LFYQLNNKSKKRFKQYLFIVPVILILLFIIGPFLIGVFTSFTDKKLYSESINFIGFKNYIDLLKSQNFRHSIYVTLKFSAMALGIQIPLGLSVAFLLNTENRFQAFWRIILVIPLLVPPVVAGLIWKTMMHPENGILNWLLESIGLNGLSWLSSINTALISVVTIDTWIFMPFVAIIFLAGIQSIPLDMLEAAKIDGANVIQTFYYLYLPWLKPHLYLILMFRVADSLKVFDIIFQTTKGGPVDATRVLSIRAYQEAIRWANTGKSLAIIVILWLIIFAISNRLVKGWTKSIGLVSKHD
jgi:multiple sugar transport system permease protein